MYATETGTMLGTKLSLNQVLVCPDITENLLSVSQLDDQGYDTLFSKEKVFIGTNGNLDEILLAGSRSNASYHVELPTPSEVYQAQSASLQDFHLRFNHLNSQDTIKLLKSTATKGFKLPDDTKLSCESCMIGKFKKGTPPKIAILRTTRPGELLHSDLCGPISTTSNGGYKYVLTFTDDFSRYVTIYTCYSPKRKYLRNSKSWMLLSTISLPDMCRTCEATMVRNIAIQALLTTAVLKE